MQVRIQVVHAVTWATSNLTGRHTVLAPVFGKNFLLLLLPPASCCAVECCCRSSFVHNVSFKLNGNPFYECAPLNKSLLMCCVVREFCRVSVWAALVLQKQISNNKNKNLKGFYFCWPVVVSLWLKQVVVAVVTVVVGCWWQQQVTSISFAFDSLF